MYVLEGITPCIQSMQLQAGDTGMAFGHVYTDYAYLQNLCNHNCIAARLIPV
mgnify:CR=1 FL=1